MNDTDKSKELGTFGSLVIISILLGSLILAGVLVGRYLAVVGWLFLLVAQIVSISYGWALGKADRIQDRHLLLESLLFSTGSLVVLPFFLQATRQVFGGGTFELMGATDSLTSWIWYSLDQVTEALLLDIPSIYALQLSPITHHGFVGSTVVLFVRLVVIALFIATFRTYLKQRHQHAESAAEV